MHSYEVAFDDWFVPATNLIGGDDGLGQGFYLQMAGFENGRLQTAARAIGVMQAAYEAAREYAATATVFGKPDRRLPADAGEARPHGGHDPGARRQFAYAVARLMAKGEGALEASMVKAYVCKAAEWVTREAMQIHGGLGYAEEYAVSRYFVDARVLSIFEGADETLCLKVIARALIAAAAPERRAMSARPREPRNAEARRAIDVLARLRRQPSPSAGCGSGSSMHTCSSPSRGSTGDNS